MHEGLCENHAFVPIACDFKSSVKIYGETQGPGNALHPQGPVTGVEVSGVASLLIFAAFCSIPGASGHPGSWFRCPTPLCDQLGTCIPSLTRGTCPYCLSCPCVSPFSGSWPSLY